VSYEPNSNWKLTLGGTNLTDERKLSSGFSQPGTGILSGTYSRGREWYATFGYKL
jgi:iron complex outermembrane receptor protein